jgi:hypothetical protein
MVWYPLEHAFLSSQVPTYSMAPFFQTGCASQSTAPEVQSTSLHAIHKVLSHSKRLSTPGDWQESSQLLWYRRQVAEASLC